MAIIGRLPEVTDLAEKKKFFQNVQIKFRRSSLALKAVVLVMLIFSIATLLLLRSEILNARTQADALKNQAAVLEAENSELDERLENQGSVDGYLEVAKEELGLVDPDTVIFDPAE